MVKEVVVNHLLALFDEGHREILIQADALSRALTNLHYEGKASFGKNLKLTKESLLFFNGPFKRHMQIEEEIVYPFFERHVPKFEPLVTLLHSEHRDIRKRLDCINSFLTKLTTYSGNSQYRRLMEEIDSESTCFVYLLRNHIKTESESVFKAIVRYLNSDEIVLLSQSIQKATEIDKVQEG